MTNIEIRHEGMRIGGEKVFTDKVIEVRYPYTDELVGTVPAGTAEHAARAFEIAANYQSKLTRYERSQILKRTGELIGERREYLAKWLVLELGICWQHAIYETKRAQDVYTFAAAQALQDDGQIFSCDLTHNGKARKIYTKREPVRAISAITPFNHPLNMVSHKIAPSIATNNKMVCKPTELTPLTAIALADILYEAGLPPEMFQIVTGLPVDIGDEMITNENIDIITFTGGVPVGKMIAGKAGYKRTALELGGNDPIIILNDLDDADLEKAATIAVAGATGNSGQRCTAVKRILVQESVADRFVLPDGRIDQVAMPDHLHLIARIPSREGISSVVRSFKHDVSYKRPVAWQAGVFDHRIRNDDSYRAKWLYVLLNPVRAGLVSRPEDWPYVSTFQPPGRDAMTSHP